MAAVARADDAWGEVSKIQYRAIDVRQVGDEPSSQHLTRHRVFGRQFLRLGGNLDGLGPGGQLQGKVDRHVLVDVDRDAGSCLRLKAFRIHRQFVAARLDAAEQEASRSVGNGIEGEPLLLVRQSDFRSGNHRVRRIVDHPNHRSRIQLRPCQSRAQAQNQSRQPNFSGNRHIGHLSSRQKQSNSSALAARPMWHFPRE